MIDKKLIGLLNHSKKYIGQTVFFNWIAMLANVVLIMMCANTIDRIHLNNMKTNQLGYILVTAVVVIGVRVLCQRVVAKRSFLAAGDVKKTLREIIYSKLLHLGSSYQEQIKISELVQVSIEGVEQLEIYFGKYLPQLFYSLLAPLTLFIILAPINLKSAVILFVCVPLIPVSIVAVQKFAKKLLAKYWGDYTGLGSGFLENLQGLTTLKIYQADERKTEQMDIEAENFRKITMKVLMMQLNSISVMDLVAFGGAAIGILIGILEYQKGAVSFGGMLMIVLLSSEFFIPMRLLGAYFHIAMNGAAASDKIFNILELEESIGGQEALNEVTPILFENVDFAYDETREILHGISFTVREKMFIAIAGVSGCGKSTIAGILAKKNKKYSGNISIGNQDFSTVSEKTLLKKITMVTNNGYLFTGTVMENLRLGKMDATEEEMISVLKKVNLFDFIYGQEGLQTRLTEEGSNLSGGQKQRLVIARALLKDTPIYIFDEATSNIDVESEADIIAIIHQMKYEKTIIMISHRLENIKLADQIYYLDSGRINESGTHEELMKTCEEYKKLYDAQSELESIRGV